MGSLALLYLWCFYTSCISLMDYFNLYPGLFNFYPGLLPYLAVVHGTNIPPSRYHHCIVANALVFSSILCSNLLILTMTFERFYSIMKPHKVASFNTVKRAKIIIIYIIILTVCFNIPHLFLGSVQGRQCLPFGTAMGKPYGELYYWLSFVISYELPFVLLLMMNSVIIHKIRNRSQVIIKHSRTEHQDQGQPKMTKMKTSDKQVYAILLLVTFGFLVLTTAGYLLFLFIMLVDFRTSPKMFAGYYLFYNIAQKLHYTNHGINFFFYVLSGQKFRTDLLKFFVTRIEPRIGLLHNQWKLKIQQPDFSFQN